MKKHFLLFALPLALLASEMPPMPPGFFDTPTKKEVEKEKPKKVERKAKKSIFPKECDVLPPMLFAFPPPMQVDVDRCTAALYKPSNELLSEKLSKLENGKVEILSVEQASEFKHLYEVKYKVTSTKKDSKFKVINKKDESEKVIYSNPKATKFFVSKPIEVK